MNQALARRQAALADRLGALSAAVVAYSGGVDSTFLAAAAHEVLGPRSIAVTADGPALTRADLAAASELARARGWNHLVVATNELARAEYRRNAPDRCYWCKTELLEVLEPIAQERDAAVLVGTNVDDLGDYRPGSRAARERGARAPLVEAGLTKADVRMLSALLGLPTADKPASPCLASRFAYGVEVSAEGLARIESAEALLRAHGFAVVRVRDHGGGLARIEVDAGDVPRAVELRDVIAGELKDLGFRHVTVDLSGFRSGSLNDALYTPRMGRS